jgi:lysophospholipase L1-like esterase
MKNMSFGRLSARLAATAAALALVAGFTAAPASATPANQQPPAPVYVALGDSYAAGTGGGTYVESPLGPPEVCRQTTAAYPVVLRPSAVNLGCFGAKTTDVVRVAETREAAALLQAATVVTVTVGGNDINTGQVALSCTIPGSTPTCGAALFDSLAVKLRDLPRRIKDMLTVVKAKAPKAKIVLTGYPRLFTLNPLLTPQQTQTAKTMNSAADLLNATIAYSALVNRVSYVSVTERFIGHGIGSTQPWIVAPCNVPVTPCTTNPFDAFHPNAAGYADGYAAALMAQVR